MSWILLLYFSWTNPAVSTARFPNKESCEQAGRWFDKHASVNNRWSCLQDITVDAPAPEPDLKTEPKTDDKLEVPQ